MVWVQLWGVCAELITKKYTAMHWILTIPQDFSLKEVIHRSRWLILPPFSTNRAPERLERVERLSTGHTALVNISQAPAGLHIHVDLHLNGVQAEELSQKVWRMLRLGETLTPFLDRARSDTVLRTCVQHGARFLRGADFFEDLIKALVLGSGPLQNAAQYLTWLVDGLGDPLTTNPTRHAFPTAVQLLNQSEQALCILRPDLGKRILHAATYYRHCAEELEALPHTALLLPQLISRLELIPGVEGSTRAYLLLALGRYDYIPDQESTTAAGETTYLDDWQPWGGLVYWLRNLPELGSACRGVQY